MHIQVVTFHLQGLSDSDFRDACDGWATAFSSVPGLISKVWLADQPTNTYGGVYTWVDREAMEAFAEATCSTPSPRTRASSASSRRTLACWRDQPGDPGSGGGRRLIDRPRRLPDMSLTVRQLMDDRAAGIVGREDERATLQRLLGADGPLVIFIHGIAGVGKSALADAFAVDARTAGATVLRLDCRADRAHRARLRRRARRGHRW